MENFLSTLTMILYKKEELLLKYVLIWHLGIQDPYV